MPVKTRKRTTRISRRELKRDPFVDHVFDWALWTRENVRALTVAGAALMVLVVAMVIWRITRANESQQAAVRYQEIFGAYAAGNYQLAANDFRQFRGQYGKSAYGDDATVYLANSYVQAGDHGAAIKVLRDFDAEHGDSPLRHASAMLLGTAYEGSGDWVKAAEAFVSARQKASFDFERVDALMAEARVRVAGGAEEGGIEAYRSVVESFGESPRAQEARVRLAELTAKPLRAAVAAAGDSAPSEGASSEKP
ncbi:MAG: tetratricopeptide repeat protein [Gemmatimonadetes bacterium]|nr:tetratricopeptide repeat protein [Gemmatimonadota bacterium]